MRMPPECLLGRHFCLWAQQARWNCQNRVDFRSATFRCETQNRLSFLFLCCRSRDAQPAGYSLVFNFSLLLFSSKKERRPSEASSRRFHCS